MALCPWCQTEVAFPNLPCRRCGKRGADHASSVRPGALPTAPDFMPAAKAHRSSPLPPKPNAAFAATAPALTPLSPAASARPGPSASPAASPQVVPDLELSFRAPPPAKVSLGPQAPKAAVPLKSARPAPVQAMPGVGGAEFDDDDVFGDGGGAGISLELDDAPAHRVSAAPPQSLAPSAKPNVRPEAATSMRPEGRAEGRPSPHAGNSVAPSEATPDEIEARELADYGPAPTHFWQKPLYAYRVKMRQAELRRLLAQRKVEAAKARGAHEDAVVAFAERARVIAEKDSAYARFVEPAAAAEKVMLAKDGQLASDTQAHKARLAQVDARIAEIETELEAARVEERNIAGELAEAEATKQRAEAKAKRAEIELRNAGARGETKADPRRA